MEKNNSHLSGEYFVAAELYRRSFSVGMTIGNAKSIDLFANKNGKTISVQVKAIAQKKNVGWPVSKPIFNDDVIYVFVNLNGLGTPEYFILTAEEARLSYKQYSSRGIINLNPLRNPQYQDRWDKLEMGKNEVSLNKK